MKLYRLLGFVLALLIASIFSARSIIALEIPVPPQPNLPNLPGVPSAPPEPSFPPLPSYPPCPECNDFIIECTPTPVTTILPSPISQPTIIPTPTPAETTSSNSGTGGTGGGGDGGSSSSGSSGTGGGEVMGLSATDGEDYLKPALILLGELCLIFGLKLKRDITISKKLLN